MRLTTMDIVLGFLLWPVAIFLQAVAGALCAVKTPTLALYQKIARLALLGSGVVFGMTIPLSLLPKPLINLKAPLAFSLVLLLVFVFFGNLCDDPSEDDDAEEHGFPGARS